MNSLSRFFSLQTPKFHYIKKSVGDRPFTILDVGSGNHSASKIKKIFPKCEYHGIDLNKTAYSYDDADEKAMSGFYEMDLSKLVFDSIPNNYFDIITMAHIIEHLHNGDKVLEGITAKLKKGGYIYIEYPGVKSTKLPSMNGTLNFYDDKSHVRVYSVSEISRLLQILDFQIIGGGIRRSWLYIAAIPFRVAASWLKGKKLIGNIFWDLFGFAEYIYARKI